MRLSEPAPAKLNLALHVRGRRPDGRHTLETVFAFCTDGDLLHAEPADELTLEVIGPFAGALANDGDNLALRAARLLAERAEVAAGAALVLDKRLPVASGIGGGSADAAAALRLLTRMWSIAPDHAQWVAPVLGADVPACLLSMTARGDGAGDELQMVDAGASGAPVLLVNPGVAVSTGEVFARWDGVDRGPLGDWREGRNDLAAAALTLAPAIGDVLNWLGRQGGVHFLRMSGSGATCFALFDDEATRDAAAADCPAEWWRLATFLR
ncbi:4-(cytidine 5'-diphospho)-2-C-methyl-D-erythritol kinase [Sphingomonas mesophila]|uniref:4-(cytidine 5'-diphospho)-2-C-methyl-D-erythritol kinase n=1 Tax=Sphingomonas mesophila TaxID=2303576 RepID=UPI000E571978|nr:4-(cytidine 5'-diphospho)-2-C-methyl-D-erythritol kinase [Sphingomonas mesophila]